MDFISTLKMHLLRIRCNFILYQ